MSIHIPVPPEDWIEKQFSFTQPVRALPGIIERLRGTPARAEELVRALPAPILTVRSSGADDSWSIQEHIGHLFDLEKLHLGRLDDYRAGLTVLRAADMSNRLTYYADHNSKPISEILARFRAERMRLVAMLETMDEAAASQSAIHPRLQKPMRVIDFALFSAEHDDHHLAGITEVARSLKG